MKMGREQKRFAFVFLAPVLVVYTVFVAVPSVIALAYSLRKWDGFAPPQWAGLDNFRVLFQPGSLFLQALVHNLFLMTVSGAAITVLALAFAAMMHRRIRGAGLFRAAFFFPNVLASVAVALIWVLLYSVTEFGLINAVLVRLGILETPFAFASSRYLLWAMIPVLVWMATGFYMVLYLAAMQNIPETYYEVARLEGASEIVQFRCITLPLIREVLVVGIVFLIISSLKTFDLVWVMENQWPAPESHVMTTLLYQKVFGEFGIGYGAAVAVVLFVLVFAATLVTLRFARREAVEY